MEAVNDGARSGLLLLDKDAGMTSSQAVLAVKKRLSVAKLGHTGTLDKFATGLLILLAGQALKLSPWFLSCDKCYEGVIAFGAETETLDPEGEVVAEAPPPDGAALEAALEGFRGPIMQAPPAYSALHIAGKRAHELARAAKAGGGEGPEMERRPVTVHELVLLDYAAPRARVRVRCSGGTYIRSLARDIALAAGSRAHLIALRRTAVAGFSVESAFPLADLPAPPAFGAITPETFAALGIPCLETDGREASWLRHGRSIDAFFARGKKAPDFPAGSLAVFGPGGAPVALLENEGGVWKYGAVWAGEIC